MATVPESPATTSARRSTDYWIFLGAAIIASIVLRLIVNTKFQAPTILTDELTYSQLARDIADGNFSLSTGYGIVYPLLLAPSWIFNQYGTEAYTWMKATNAVLVSLTAIPVFFWAKRMMQPRYALLAAVLTLLMPSMAYSGLIMTENAFLLFFMLAAWSISVAVERPTVLHQVLVVVAITAAFATRAQAVVLLAALPLIIVLHVLAEERATDSLSLAGCGRRLVRFWPLAAIAALGVLAIVIRTLATDWHASQLLQAYSSTAGGQYTVPTVSRYFAWHLGEATFALGVIPVAALLLLVGMGVLNRTRSAAERAYLCTAIVAIPLVILQVAIFTSWFSQRVSERNMFCVFPIVLIGLVLWLSRKSPRPIRVTAFAAGCAGVLTMLVPYAYLYTLSPSTETWALVTPEFLSRKAPRGPDDVQLMIIVGTIAALFIFAFIRSSASVIVIPLVVTAFFAVEQVAVVHTVGKASSSYRSVPSLGSDANWLDQSVPRNESVGFLLGTSLGPEADRLITWQTGFFNRHSFSTATWGTDIVSDPLTGVVTAPGGTPTSLPPYVITPSAFELAGSIVANRGAFLLTTPSAPYRLNRQTSGLFPDGWSGAQAAINYYVATPLRTVHIQIDRGNAPASAPPSTVTITTGRIATLPDGTAGINKPTAMRSTSVSARSSIDMSIAIPESPMRIELTFSPTFRRSDFGQDDSREIGGRVTVTLGTKVIS